ncbi:MAG TPA: hypothetical protein VLY87_02350, partial [Flavobacterium sp.]|nr:hypothetical protein [Flavobacterium sp.]
MNKLLKITQILIFTVLLLIIGVFIWQFFNAYASLMLFPLGFLSIYYLLLYSFVKLLQNQTSKMWFYIGIVFIIVPLIAFSVAYQQILEFSL